MACQNKIDGLYPAASIPEAGADRLLHLTLAPVCSGALHGQRTLRTACVYGVCRKGIQAASQMDYGSCRETSRTAMLHPSSCGTILLIPPIQERPTKHCQFVFITQGCCFRELLLLIFHSWKYPSCVTTKSVSCFNMLLFFPKEFFYAIS